MSRFKQNWPGYYAVFISKDPVVPQVNYLHRWAWGGGGNLRGAWNLAEKD